MILAPFVAGAAVMAIVCCVGAGRKKPTPQGAKGILPRKNDPSDACSRTPLCKKEFAQQMLHYNQFYVTPTCFAMSYLVVGIILLIFGGIFAADADLAHETQTKMYDDTDSAIEIIWDGPTDKPVFLYYFVGGFFKAHRSFQENGYVTSTSYVRTMVKYRSMFDDVLVAPDLDTKGIALPSDVDVKATPCVNNTKNVGFGRQHNFTADAVKGKETCGHIKSPGPIYGSFSMGIDVGTTYYCQAGPPTASAKRRAQCECQTEACLVWASCGAGGTEGKHYKLYGKFPTLAKGKLTISIPQNQWPKSTPIYKENKKPWLYEGQPITKGIMLSTMGAYGGKKGSSFLAQLSLAGGAVMIVLALLQALFHRAKVRDVDEYLRKMRSKHSRGDILGMIKKYA